MIDDKVKMLNIGYLLLRLEHLHKLGLKALQLASLVYHMTDLVMKSQDNSEQIMALTDYCVTKGVGCMSAAHNVMLMMQACIEEIRDFHRNNGISATKEIAETAAETSEFISHLSSVLSATIRRISDLLIVERKPKIKSEYSEYFGVNKLLAFNAVEMGEKLLKELEQDTIEFGAISANIFEWIEKSTVTTHAGGFLKIYRPPVC